MTLVFLQLAFLMFVLNRVAKARFALLDFQALISNCIACGRFRFFLGSV